LSENDSLKSSSKSSPKGSSKGSSKGSPKGSSKSSSKGSTKSSTKGSTKSSANDATSQDTLFGRMAVEQSLCTEDEFKKCDVHLRKVADSAPSNMPTLMVKHGFITKNQAKRVRAMIKESKAAAGQIPGYKVSGKLGSGAMAVVYKATQLSLDRTVAIKVLPKRFAEKSNYITRFYKEGKLAAKLNHNNIVQAIEIGEAGGLYYFVMEYVEGKTLFDDLSKGKIFTEDEALDLMIQLCNALDHAHKLGMVHRDVKPKNIMITPDGVVKLADMGLARETSDIEAAESEKGKAFGTPYYIAPEQVRGEVDIDGRADLYAVGATLFHMLTGRVPFQAKTPSEVMRKHLTEQIVPPDHINTSLSGGISEVIEVAMSKKKQDRYSTIEELLVDLHAVKNGETPAVAEGKFSLEGLEQLEEEGVDVDLELDEEQADRIEQIVAKYRIIMIVMGAAIAILVLVLGYMGMTG
jgi:serine/threonine protein kinase